MYKYEAELVFRSYMPQKLEKGMLFITITPDENRLWELEAVPGNKDRFLKEHGAPVELSIIDQDGNIIAEHHEIGWWDDGEDVDELRDISIDDVNLIINNYDGWLEIEIIEELYDEQDLIVPNFIEEKVIINLITEEENE